MENHDQIKLIALDIDGTIMKKDFSISDTVRSTIKKAIDSDVKVVLATGRMYSATVPIANELGIQTPLITYQGALVRNFYNSDEILLHHTIDADLFCQVISDIRNFQAQINVYLDDELFVEDEKAILKEYAVKRHIVYHKVNSFDKVAAFNPTKIIAMDDDVKKVDTIRDKLKKKYENSLYVTKSTPFYCEFVNKKASKGNAILFLAKKWGIKQSEIMVIGDQDNDKEMLSVAGLAVAMGNSTDGLKEIADFITDTVDNDGAAAAIEKFVFNKGM